MIFKGHYDNITKLLLQEPVRTCIGCGIKRKKSELLRITLSGGGIEFDPRMRLPGRGAYVCPDQECLTKGIGVRPLSRSFRRKIGADAVSALAESVAESGNTGEIISHAINKERQRT
ncbi:MAG: YlxR family protein [Nitrospirae bacterium]|nr:YlxR family protein [Nitrospirota bacterium]